MLVNAVVYTFPAEHAETAATLFLQIATESRAEPGCIGFDVNRSNDDPCIFMLYERWADAAALEAHYATEHFHALGVNGIRPLAQSRLAYQCTPLTT